MCATGSANPPPKIGTLEVYKRLLETRDFELTTFWQRSIFLGTFLSLSYTGYGALGLKLLETKGGEAIWQVGNLFAIVIACFGIIVSTLWILMAKGSKLWYEWQETAISAFVHGLAPKSAFDADYIQDAAAFKIGWTAEFDNRWREVKKDNFLFSPNGGPFSVSKVTICIGQFSLMGLDFGRHFPFDGAGDWMSSGVWEIPKHAWHDNRRVRLARCYCLLCVFCLTAICGKQCSEQENVRSQ